MKELIQTGPFYLRKSNDERMATDDLVQFFVQEIIAGRLAPNTSPEAVVAQFPTELRASGRAIAVMMHACRLAADEAGAVMVVSLNDNSRIIGQFDLSENMDEKELEANAFDIAAEYRSQLQSHEQHFWSQPSLNLERMPRFNYSENDGAVLSFYAEHIASCDLPSSAMITQRRKSASSTSPVLTDKKART